MTTDLTDQGPKTLGQRLLAPIADVRRHEVISVLLMTLVMFLVLAAYYQLKTAREVFILSEGGAAVKSYSSAGQAVLLLFLVPAYGAFASRVNRVQLVQWVTMFFVSNIVLFLLALSAGLHIGIAYFLWVGIFNLMVIAQFWAFAADLYTPEQGKRLFPLIGVGASLGVLIGCALLARIVNRVTQRDATAKVKPADEKPLAAGNGFAMIFADRYLMLIALLAVLINVVNTTGEYLFGRYVVEAAQLAHPGEAATAAREQFIGAAYSRLFSTVNLVGFLLQMFVVSRIFKFLGVGKSLFIHPIVALAGYLMMLRAPSIGTMGMFKVADNSLDYSLGNTTKQALWLPTSREAKYKAKQAVDSFFVRMGDVLQAALVFIGERMAFAVPAFAAVVLVLVGAWLGVVALLNRQLRAKADHAGTRQL
jgi:ATP:ADP antiporter, AAA family